MPGEGEVGCLFDEISNLVEPTERSAMDGVVPPEQPGPKTTGGHTRSAAGNVLHEAYLLRQLISPALQRLSHLLSRTTTHHAEAPSRLFFQ
jgi:hypothetical protein